MLNRKSKHTFCVQYFIFFENRAVYELNWKNIVDRGRPRMTKWHKPIACWVPKATNTHSGCAILVAFPMQQWLHECASMLHYTYIACLVGFFIGAFAFLLPVTSVSMSYISAAPNRRISVKYGIENRCKITNKCVEIVVGFIDAFLDFPQHVSASNCHHQGGRSVVWLHPPTTNHTGRIIIHIHPQYRSCLSSFRGTTTPLMMAITYRNMLGKI
jgi:hypothetical protein